MLKASQAIGQVHVMLCLDLGSLQAPSRRSQEGAPPAPSLLGSCYPCAALGDTALSKSPLLKAVAGKKPWVVGEEWQRSSTQLGSSLAEQLMAQCCPVPDPLAAVCHVSGSAQ